MEYEHIKKPQLLKKLLKLLAFQIGSEVSLSELATNLEIDKKTIEKYLDLLEKSFVIFSLPAWSKNLRKEITKSKKYYFYDLGVRNALIENFNSLDIRPDRGALFENFFIVERLKRNHYDEYHERSYFWRTYDKKEIDYLEESPDGHLSAFECKWSEKNSRVPKDFLVAYPQSSFVTVHKENFFQFL